jgi:4-nitrophenyl phosphatase
MKAYKGYLIDLDGTVYRGTEPIPEAIEFVKKLKEKGIPYLYVTNNSTTTPEKVAERLDRMGAPATAENVLTTSQAAARYISNQKPNGTVYYIGEEGLKVALENEGLTYQEETPDFVIVGLDRQVTYAKFEKACFAIRAGSQLVSTNSDIALSTERGLAPGNGALTALISTSTQTNPVFIGKPEAIILEEALVALNLSKSDVIMVGDNYHTDILAGLNAGMDTLFVNTGVTTLEELASLERKPTYTVHSLSEWNVL